MDHSVHRSRLLLAALAVSLAACAPRSSPAATATRVPTVGGEAAALPTPTAYIMPTPPPAPTPVCPGAPPRRLILHERGRVLPDDPRPVNLRAEPGLASRVVVQLPINSLFYVLEGPVCEGDFSWFRVSLNGQEGWLAEGDLTSYYVEPYLPG